MKNLVVIIFKVIKLIYYKISDLYSCIITHIYFYLNDVKTKGKITLHGIPYVNVSRGGNFIIKGNITLNSSLSSNPIGRNQKCSFFVKSEGMLEIGNNVGLSATAIVCASHIKIGDNVKIGGGTCIYDTDFHSLNYSIRNSAEDLINSVSKAVIIEKNVFIGAHVIILKGVTIGSNAIIGAGSIVTKSIPANEIWAGNPAKKISDIQLNVY